MTFTIAGPVPIVPALADPPEPAPAEPSTLVIEAGVIPRRVRRPLDLARFAVALAITGATVFLAWFESSLSSYD